MNPPGNPVYDGEAPVVSGWRNGSLTAFWSDVFARPGGVVAHEIGGGSTRLLVDEHVGKAAVQVLIWLDVQVSPSGLGAVAIDPFAVADLAVEGVGRHVVV